MCCYNNVREKWIISLVLVGVFFSLGVAVPMILTSYPGNECLMFVSVRDSCQWAFCKSIQGAFT